MARKVYVRREIIPYNFFDYLRQTSRGKFFINFARLQIIVFILALALSFMPKFEMKFAVRSNRRVYSNKPQVRGTFAESILKRFELLKPTNTPTPTLFLPTPTPTPRKESYTIAVIGDSMVDTMGERLEYLEHALKAKYPRTEFILYNYGEGAQNVEEGVGRFSSGFDNVTRHFIPLPEFRPDILIVGSFAYNPFSPHNRDRHWLNLKTLVEQAKTVSSDVYMLAEVAPLRDNFGQGPNGVNWSQATSYEHSGRIVELLENAVNLGKELNVPVIDAYSRSVNQATKEGNKKLVNPSDGIHPSVEGHEFTAELISSMLKL